jgi:ubiquinone/menaquinone biosynthesis C-methylase UbiE
MAGPLARLGSTYDRLFAALYDPILAGPERAGLAAARAQLLRDVTGRVLEIGAGTGANLAHLPSGLESLVLVEPSAPMRARLELRVSERHSHLPADVRVVDGTASALRIPDGSIDTVISTLVLCSVPVPEATIAELRRVLAPHGRLLLIEHVAGHGRTARLQRLIDPVWRIVGRGCRLVRDTRSTLEDGGFDTAQVDDWSLPGGGITGPALLGTARPR